MSWPWSKPPRADLQQVPKARILGNIWHPFGARLEKEEAKRKINSCLENAALLPCCCGEEVCEEGREPVCSQASSPGPLGPGAQPELLLHEVPGCLLHSKVKGHSGWEQGEDAAQSSTYFLTISHTDLIFLLLVHEGELLVRLP